MLIYPWCLIPSPDKWCEGFNNCTNIIYTRMAGIKTNILNYKMFEDWIVAHECFLSRLRLLLTITWTFSFSHLIIVTNFLKVLLTSLLSKSLNLATMSVSNLTSYQVDYSTIQFYKFIFFHTSSCWLTLQK